MTQPSSSTLVAVVANPLRTDDPQALRAELETIAHGRSHELLWLETTEDDPGAGQARHALERGAAMVFALGGDGTVRTVAKELVGSDAALGLLPAGTGNLLARNLHVNKSSAADAFTLALDGRSRTIDVGWVAFDGGTEHLFLVMAGMGYDAHMMDGTSEEAKARLGWFAYAVTGVKGLFHKGFHVRVRGGVGPQLHQHARSVLVGNCGELTGGLVLMPEARLDDGLLDLLLLAPEGLMGWGATAWRVITRRHHGHEALRGRTGAQFRVQVGSPTLSEVDGDAVGEHRTMTARVQPGALHVRVAREDDDD